ncbi:MAG: M23 family metallopeptidase [Syntrophales bacterium]|jgi:lipoprotein NlpD
MGRLHKHIILIPLIILVLFGCVRDYAKPESRKGYYYVIKPGDTLYSIAKANRISVKELSDSNNLTNTLIKEGTVLFVPAEAPAAKEVTQKPKEKEEGQSTPFQGKLEKQGEIQEKARQINDRNKGTPIRKQEGVERGKFIWPVEGRVISKYGPQPNGMFYNGIRIETKTETVVLAASGGQVIFSALLKDYGETVIIKHDQNYATVYTHLGKRLVQIDQLVKKGQKIALSVPGPSGKGSIDFEIRHHNKTKDPLLFLP